MGSRAAEDEGGGCGGEVFYWMGCGLGMSLLGGGMGIVWKVEGVCV